MFLSVICEHSYTYFTSKFSRSMATETRNISLFFLSFSYFTESSYSVYKNLNQREMDAMLPIYIYRHEPYNNKKFGVSPKNKWIELDLTGRIVKGN